MEGGFQYSNFESVQETSSGADTVIHNGYTTVISPASGSLQKFNGDLYGADIQVGYKQFFGKTKRFGLRYYGFFSGQGGSAIYQQNKMVITQPAANLFYGAGIDALLNFYDENNSTFGVFAGVMLGGSSWLMGKGRQQDGQCVFATPLTDCTTMNDYYNYYSYPPDYNANYVQFIFNVGFRANLSKHQGFEVGVRIPTIDDPYYTTSATTSSYGGTTYYTQGSFKQTLTFRRNIAAYLNYVINF
ncbi:outer membrane protein [Helicobacter suis]|uniref:outer membrane protein n=1 Tax=Helicobacter suis TaxID=104628 RepID=UPI0019689AFB|nr:outer membrane protein [Helicobacter suis]